MGDQCKCKDRGKFCALYFTVNYVNQMKIMFQSGGGIYSIEDSKERHQQNWKRVYEPGDKDHANYCMSYLW